MLFFPGSKDSKYATNILNTECITLAGIASLYLQFLPPHHNLSMTRELLQYSLHTGLSSFLFWVNGKWEMQNGMVYDS